MDLSAMVEKHLDHDISLNPVTVAIGGNNFTGRKLSMGKDRAYSEYGFDTEYKFSVILRIGSLADDGVTELAEPEQDSVVTINSINYRVIEKEIGGTGRKLTLHLGPDYE